MSSTRVNTNMANLNVKLVPNPKNQKQTEEDENSESEWYPAREFVALHKKSCNILQNYKEQLINEKRQRAVFETIANKAAANIKQIELEKKQLAAELDIYKKKTSYNRNNSGLDKFKIDEVFNNNMKDIDEVAFKDIDKYIREQEKILGLNFKN
jgi:hypothetical protein